MVGHVRREQFLQSPFLVRLIELEHEVGPFVQSILGWLTERCSSEQRFLAHASVGPPVAVRTIRRVHDYKAMRQQLGKEIFSNVSLFRSSPKKARSPAVLELAFRNNLELK
jgi:hypothetical protein